MVGRRTRRPPQNTSIKSKFGGCKRQDSPAKRNPVQTGNTTTTTTTTTTNNNSINRRCEGETPKKNTKVVANPGNRDRVRRPWGVRACVARDRWHRAWRDRWLRGCASDGHYTSIAITTDTCCLPVPDPIVVFDSPRSRARSFVRSPARWLLRSSATDSHRTRRPSNPNKTTTKLPIAPRAAYGYICIYIYIYIHVYIYIYIYIYIYTHRERTIIISRFLV